LLLFFDELAPEEENDTTAYDDFASEEHELAAEWMAVWESAAPDAQILLVPM